MIAAILKMLLLAAPWDDGPSADLEALGGGGVLVDSDLVRAVRPGAGDERERVEARRAVRAEREAGRAAVA